MESTGQGHPKVSCRAIYLLLVVPAALFIVSLFIRPAMVFDTAEGFIVLRSMLEGGPFNYLITTDPENIANDIGTFLSWWTPGQYLVPGTFVWMGADYGLAISLTSLIALVIGVLGWIQIARRFEVSCWVLFLFVLGLVTFHYATTPFFRYYSGGEVLLFAVLPWSLSALQWAIKKTPAVSLTVSMLFAALLFFAKLSGLIAFAASVVAITLLEVLSRRRLTASVLAMWAGSAVAAVLLLVFWLARGRTPLGVPTYAFVSTWSLIRASIPQVAFSGFSLSDLLVWLFLHPSAPAPSEFSAVYNYVLEPLGLLLVGWVWFRLRNTRFRGMAICLLSIIAAYVAVSIAVFAVSSRVTIPFEERYFRYAGILFYLLLLVAVDQWHGSLIRVIPILIVGIFAVYGLSSYANGARELMRGRHYDRVSGTSVLSVSPVVLEYLRSQMVAHRWQHAIVVVPGPEAVVGLPHFRVILDFVFVDYESVEDIALWRLAGRAEKIFVILKEKNRDNGNAEALLRTFVDYDLEKWNQIQMDGMIVYSQ
jgi:hypothetical protein